MHVCMYTCIFWNYCVIHYCFLALYLVRLPCQTNQYIVTRLVLSAVACHALLSAWWTVPYTLWPLGIAVEQCLQNANRKSFGVSNSISSQFTSLQATLKEVNIFLPLWKKKSLNSKLCQRKLPKLKWYKRKALNQERASKNYRTLSNIWVFRTSARKLGRRNI